MKDRFIDGPWFPIVIIAAGLFFLGGMAGLFLAHVLSGGGGAAAAAGMGGGQAMLPALAL